MYEIFYTETALKDLKKLDKQMQERIIKVLERIRHNPFKYVRKLQGREDYRLRVGDYRIIMRIDQGKLIILIVAVGHRRNIYKRG